MEPFLLTSDKREKQFTEVDTRYRYHLWLSIYGPSLKDNNVESSSEQAIMKINIIDYDLKATSVKM